VFTLSKVPIRAGIKNVGSVSFCAFFVLAVFLSFSMLILTNLNTDAASFKVPVRAGTKNVCI
jgi:hypothetical protein